MITRIPQTAIEEMYGAAFQGISWVWRKAMDLVTEVYKLTDTFPKREVYSLTDQIRRAAVSVPSNIAEGQAHYNRGEFLHFLRRSAGSLAELETQIMIAERLGYSSAL